MDTIGKIQKLVKNIEGVSFDPSILSNMNPDILIKLYNVVQSLTFQKQLNSFKYFYESHDYSKNTLKELELLLKHHYEDKKEGSCPDDIDMDIEEIKREIKSRKLKMKTFKDAVQENAVLETKVKKTDKGDLLNIVVNWSGKAFHELNKLDKKFIGTEDYMGVAYFWANDYKHSLRDADPIMKKYVHDLWMELDLSLDGVSDEHKKVLEKLKIY